jgi:hypothetical protein
MKSDHPDLSGQISQIIFSVIPHKEKRRITPEADVLQAQAEFKRSFRTAK